MIIAYTALFLVIVYLFERWKNSRHKKNIPGRKGLPFIGHGLEMNHENMNAKLFDLSKKQGEYFIFNLFGQKILCLNSCRAIKLALAGQDYKHHMNDRAPSFYAERFLYGSQSVVFWPDGFSPVHGEMRKVINACFHFYGDDGRDRFERKVGLELQRLDSHLQSLGNGEVDVVNLLRHSVANTICIALTGEAFKEDDPGIDMIWDFIEGTNFFILPVTNFLMTSFPFLRFVPGVYKTVYDRQMAAKGRIIQKFFTEHKNGRKPGIRRGIVDQLLDSQEEDIKQGKSPLFTDEPIHAAILETLNAGILITWSVLSSTILMLLHYPEYQKRARTELCAAIGWDDVAHSGDRERCPLTEAIEMEAHRLVTVVPLLIPRECNKDLEFEGYDVPKKTAERIKNIHICL